VKDFSELPFAATRMMERARDRPDQKASSTVPDGITKANPAVAIVK
jgi:hypothetical protein